MSVYVGSASLKEAEEVLRKEGLFGQGLRMSSNLLAGAHIMGHRFEQIQGRWGSEKGTLRGWGRRVKAIAILLGHTLRPLLAEKPYPNFVSGGGSDESAT